MHIPCFPPKSIGRESWGQKPRLAHVRCLMSVLTSSSSLGSFPYSMGIDLGSGRVQSSPTKTHSRHDSPFNTAPQAPASQPGPPSGSAAWHMAGLWGYRPWARRMVRRQVG